MDLTLSHHYFLLLVFGLAVTGVASWLKYWSDQRVAETLKNLAPQIGFTYRPEDSSAPSLQIHAPSEISCVMHGTASGLETVLYYYMYTNRTTTDDVIMLTMPRWRSQRQRYFAQTVAAFKMPITIADFEMRPEGLFNKIGSALGQQDINFDSHPEFSERYLLRGDEAQVRRFFTSPLLGFFEKLEEGWSVESSGAWLVIYRFRHVVKPNLTAYREFIHKTSFIASAVYKTACREHSS
jgi:hypothetical protein